MRKKPVLAGRTNAKLAAFAPSWSTELRAPLYHRIFLIIRNKILSGEYADGALLPSEAELSSMFGVSRITTKRALNEIAEAGFAVRQRGRGTRVHFKGGGTMVSGGLQGLRDSLRANARTAATVLAFGDTPAPPDAAAALKIAAGETVQRAVRVFSDVNRVPYSHLTTYVPLEVGARWTKRDLESNSLVALIERSGVAIDSAEQIISATLADADLAVALKVDFASPLLKVVRTVYARGGKPVQYLTALYPPDRYRFMMSLDNDGEDSLRVV